MNDLDMGDKVFITGHVRPAFEENIRVSWQTREYDATKDGVFIGWTDKKKGRWVWGDEFYFQEEGRVRLMVVQVLSDASGRWTKPVFCDPKQVWKVKDDSDS